MVRVVVLTPVIFNTRVYARIRVGGVALAIALLLTSVGIATLHPLTTEAAVSSNLNFQARLENAAGGIASDGNYNVQFKLYNASTGGSALWTESYLNSASHGVTVTNGYLSVNLGSITAFPDTIAWDQDLYVTMNIGGTDPSTPSYDGEMNPRLKLTAVPYAFQAKSASQLQVSSGGNVSTLGFITPTGTNTIQLPDASGTVCLVNNAACGFAATSGSANYIQNGTGVQTGSDFNISGTGTIGSTLTVAGLATMSNGLTVTTGATSLGGTLGVTGLATLTGGLINPGSTLNTASALGDLAAGALGTAAATVDTHTAFTIAPTVSGRTYTIPSPTTTTAGRVIYITNVDGSHSFSIGSVLFSPGSTAMYVWSGSAWGFGSIDTGVTTIGAINGGGYSANGAAISGNTIYLQSADASNGGILTNGTQTITGAKTFNTGLTASLGLTVSGAVTNINNGSNFDTNINTGGSTGAVNIGNGSAGAISILGNSTIAIGGNNNGAITIGESSNNGNGINIGTGTGSTPINIGTENNSGAIAIGTKLQNTSITIGGVLQTGNITFGQSTNTNSVRIGNGTITSGNTGTVSIGTNATGSGKTVINIGSGNDASSVSLQAGTGGISLDGVTTINGGSSSNAVNIGTGTSSGAISLGNSNTGNVTIQSGSSPLLIGGSTQVGTITLGSSSGNNTVNIGTGTGSTVVNIGTENTSGAISIGTKLQNTSITIGGGSQTGAIYLGQSVETNAIHIGDGIIANGNTEAISIGTNATGTGKTQTTIGNTNANSSVTLQGGASSGAISIQSNTSGTIAIGTSGVANTLRLGNTSGAVAQTISLGANATASSTTTLTLGSTIGTSTTTIQGGTGGLILAPSGGSNTGVTVKPGTDSTSAFLVQNAGATETLFNIDTTNNRIKVGNNTGTGANTTLLILDQATTNPGTNAAFLGSMYFDTTADNFMCYSSAGWGACGASPDISVNLIPEYVGSVLNGSKFGSNNVGTLSSDLCSNGTLALNTGLCANSGEDYNYYNWSSPQASAQSYSIYVRYQLPATFKTFGSDSTIQLTGRSSDVATNATGSTLQSGVAYTMYYTNTSTGAVTACGSTTQVTTSANTWQTVSLGGSGETSCTANSGVTGGIGPNTILTFKIDVTSKSGSNAYVSNLSFLTKGK